MGIQSPSLSKVETNLLKIHTKRQLSSSVAALPGGLRRLQYAERRRAANVRGWRREVGVIQSVGEGRFKSKPEALSDWKDLRQPRRHRNGSRTFQYTHARVADSSRAGRCWRKCIEVPQEFAANPRVGISDYIGPGGNAAP